MKIKHLIGFHNLLNSRQVEGERIRVPNPWGIFVVKESRFECGDCGRRFWMPMGNFLELRTEKWLTEEALRVSDELWKQGRYEDAIEVLKVA